MNLRSQLSRNRLYRSMSVCLAVSTALLMIPPEWITLHRLPEEPQEPEAREVRIVRVPPETLPPPPPLPDPPEPEPEPEPETEPEPEPEPEPLTPRLELEEPLIEVPRDERERQDVELSAERLDPRFEPEDPPVDVEIPRAREAEPIVPKIASERRESLEQQPDEIEVTVPKHVPRAKDARQIEVAAATERSYVDAEAPDVEVVTPRPSARRADRPSLDPVSQQLRTGVAITQAEDEPVVDVPRGNTARPSQNAPVAVSGAVTGTRVVYDDDPGDAREVAVATPSRPAAGGDAPKLAVTRGGTSGLEYSTAPEGVPAGPAPSGAADALDPKLEQVRAALSRRYGLPLVSVGTLGARSTEAARWNLLLPQISDLLRASRDLGEWSGGPDDDVRSITRDGRNLMIRYDDGIVHVLVPTEDGLASLFVARAADARDVISKVHEAELARSALHEYMRGTK